MSDNNRPKAYMIDPPSVIREGTSLLELVPAKQEYTPIATFTDKDKAKDVASILNRIYLVCTICHKIYQRKQFKCKDLTCSEKCSIEWAKNREKKYNGYK